MWHLFQIPVAVASQAGKPASQPEDPISFYTTNGTIGVGRPPKGATKPGDADVFIRSDASISKVHAELSTSRGPNGTSLSITDKSRYGTFVNNEKLDGEQKTVELKEGDIVRFAVKTAFRVQRHNLVLYVSRSIPELQQVLSVADSLGACVKHEWDASVTHTIMENQELATLGHLASLVSNVPLISSKWLHELNGTKVWSSLPETENYRPTMMEVRGSGVSSSLVRELPSASELLSNKALLAGLSFVCTDQECLAVSLFGGRVIDTGRAAGESSSHANPIFTLHPESHSALLRTGAAVEVAENEVVEAILSADASALWQKAPQPPAPSHHAADPTAANECAESEDITEEMDEEEEGAEACNEPNAHIKDEPVEGRLHSPVQGPPHPSGVMKLDQSNGLTMGAVTKDSQRKGYVFGSAPTLDAAAAAVLLSQQAGRAAELAAQKAATKARAEGAINTGLEVIGDKGAGAAKGKRKVVSRAEAEASAREAASLAAKASVATLSGGEGAQERADLKELKEHTVVFVKLTAKPPAEKGRDDSSHGSGHAIPNFKAFRKAGQQGNVNTLAAVTTHLKMICENNFSAGAEALLKLLYVDKVNSGVASKWMQHTNVYTCIVASMLTATGCRCRTWTSVQNREGLEVKWGVAFSWMPRNAGVAQSMLQYGPYSSKKSKQLVTMHVKLRQMM
eukprot:gene2369-8678_t